MKATARRRRPSRSPIPYRNISRRLRSNQSHRRRVRRSKAAPWYAQCRRVWRRAVKRKSRLLPARNRRAHGKTASCPVARAARVIQSGPAATPPVRLMNARQQPRCRRRSCSRSKQRTKAWPRLAMRCTIEVKNLGHGAVEGVRVVDQLPAGFRYIEGSALMNHTPMTEPEGKPGPQLRFQLPPIPAQAAVRYSYRVRIGVGAQQGDGTNRAQARPPYGEPSNETSAQVKVRGGVFTEEACVVGKVFVDCNHNHIQDAEELGIPGVRLYLEDGAYFITDAEGKYSYCGLSAKSHVIKIDPITLPRGSRLTTTSNRNLGDANSLFLDVKKGE